MRCTAVVAGLGLLVSPARLPHRSAYDVPPWSAAWCPRPLKPRSDALEKISWVYPGRVAKHRDPSRSAAAFAAMGGSRQRTQRIGGGSTTAAYRRIPRMQAHRKASVPDNDRTLLPTLSVGSAAAVVVWELQRGLEDTDTLAVYGKLHHVLGATRCRRLLGPDAVATLTSLNYLVVHHRDGGPSLYHEGFAEGEKEASVGGARLALGDCCWDICGIGQWGPTADSAMRRAGKERTPLVADQHLFEREIESVAKLTSRSEVFTMKLIPAERLLGNEGTARALLPRTARTARQNVRQLYARTQSVWALARTPPPCSSYPPKTTSPTPENPLLRVGLGALMSRRDCNTMLREALENEDWAPWDGDLGKRAVATGLENLPLSRALWDGKAGAEVRARIAGVYGVPAGSIVVDVGGVFVCKVGVDVYGEQGETPKQEEQGRRSARKREQTTDETAAIVAEQQRQRGQQEQQRGSIESAKFRRSKSLMTFWVALGAEDASPCSWAVCLEQRGVCVRPMGQGSGVVLSGKLRHASVRVPPGAGMEGLSAGSGEEGSAERKPPVMLLRGFASIRHPSVLEESARWQWGSPAWHVDAPWIKDQDILDRVWVVGGRNVGADSTGETDPPPPPTAAGAAAAGAATAGAAEAPGRYHLPRMNSTLAHRYYRQGLAGMGVPVVDALGRPVIDIVEDGRASLLPSWSRGVLGSDKAGEVTLKAVLRRRFPWGRRRQVGKAGLSTEAGASPRMDAALRELFRTPSSSSSVAGPGAAGGEQGGGEPSLVGVPVPPIKYVFVDPRYRGLGLGRRLFLEAMRNLAGRGFRFALIVVEDNGSGGLFGFYEDMGFVRADELLGLPRAMIAPIPPPDGL